MSSTPSAIQSLSGLFQAPGSDMNSTQGPTLGGSNQYMQFPSLPQTGSAGTIPTYTGSGPGPASPVLSGNQGPGSAGQSNTMGSLTIDPTMDPNYTQQFYNWLQSQVGTGVPGFNASTVLPSSGQATQPGQLNAPLNNVYQQLQSFLTGGPSSIPGSSQATTMAQTGNPVDQTAAWQAMVASQAQNTAQNANNLREQFAFGGDLKSSPFGSAMQQFYNQNALNQNAQLTQATATAQENAQNRELSAQQGLEGLAGTTGSNLQTIDQNAINQMLQEFNYTLPENNPLNQILAGSANTSPNISQGQTASQTFGNITKGISDILGSL